jgi:CheY-like chemotaxis protein
VSEARILLVEDDADDVVLFQEALRDGGFRPELHIVGDGAQALSFLRREGRWAMAPVPDLVILDLNLPRVDGHQVLQAVKGDPQLGRIPIVVFTTSGRPEDVEGAYDEGANAYIQKPMTFEHLLEVTAKLEDFWFGLVTSPPHP